MAKYGKWLKKIYAKLTWQYKNAAIDVGCSIEDMWSPIEQSVCSAKEKRPII